MGFLESIGARPYEYPMDCRSADWILRRIGNALDTGSAFLATMTPYERRQLFDSYYMQLPKDNLERVGYLKNQSPKMTEECDKYYKENRNSY